MHVMLIKMFVIAKQTILYLNVESTCAVFAKKTALLVDCDWPKMSKKFLINYKICHCVVAVGTCRLNIR